MENNTRDLSSHTLRYYNAKPIGKCIENETFPNSDESAFFRLYETKELTINRQNIATCVYTLALDSISNRSENVADDLCLMFRAESIEHVNHSLEKVSILRALLDRIEDSLKDAGRELCENSTRTGKSKLAEAVFSMHTDGHKVRTVDDSTTLIHAKLQDK